MLYWVSAYYVEGVGFTYLVGKGEGTGAPLDWEAKWGVRVFDHDREPGYDAQYYAQLALEPTVEDLELQETIDNVPYRARRILLPWVSHLLGMGQPNAVMQVFSLLNIASWLALGVVLLRWFPPVDLDRAWRWCGLMFSTGWCLSIYLSLVDGPSVLLLALALRWYEQNRPWRAGFALALGGLAKETNIIAGGLAAPEDWSQPRAWWRALPRLLLVVAPLALWVVWLRFSLRPAEHPIGAPNFEWPFVAIWNRANELADSWAVGDVIGVYWFASAAALIGLLVQGGFLLLRWQWRSAAWRLAVPFAVLMLVIGEAVWEGSPGASDRVLLPMLLCFNMLLPRGGRWWVLLVLGNLSMWFGPVMLRPVPAPIQSVVLSPAILASWTERTAPIEVQFPRPWQALEAHGDQSWRWAGGDAEIMVVNRWPSPVQINVVGRWASAYEREATLWINDALLWSDELTKRPADWRVAGVQLEPGENRFRITSDQPAVNLRGDGSRSFAVMLLRFEIEVVGEAQP